MVKERAVDAGYRHRLHSSCAWLVGMCAYSQIHTRSFTNKGPYIHSLNTHTHIHMPFHIQSPPPVFTHTRTQIHTYRERERMECKIIGSFGQHHRVITGVWEMVGNTAAHQTCHGKVMVNICMVCSIKISSEGRGTIKKGLCTHFPVLSTAA